VPLRETILGSAIRIQITHMFLSVSQALQGRTKYR
jgi:hypothetical protein